MAGKVGGARPVVDEKKRRFAEFWLSDPKLCIYTAFRKAYDPENKLKKESVWVKASQLLRDVKVKEYIESIQIKRAKKLDVSLERTLQEIMDLAYVNMDDFVEWEEGKVTLKPSNSLTRRMKGAVQSVKVVEAYGKDGDRKVTTDFKLYPKGQSLDMLMKHLGAYIDTVLLKGTGKDGAIQIEELEKTKTGFIDILAARGKELGMGKTGQKKLN